MANELFGNLTKELSPHVDAGAGVLTGGAAEGFGIPIYFRRHESTHEQALEMLADVDIIVINKGLVCTSESAYTPAIPECLGYFEYVEDPPQVMCAFS